MVTKAWRQDSAEFIYSAVEFSIMILPLHRYTNVNIHVDGNDILSKYRIAENFDWCQFLYSPL